MHDVERIKPAAVAYCSELRKSLIFLNRIKTLLEAKYIPFFDFLPDSTIGQEVRSSNKYLTDNMLTKPPQVGVTSCDFETANKVLSR